MQQEEPGNEATSCNRKSLGTRLHATGGAWERGYVIQLGMRLPHATGGAWERGYLMQQEEPGNEATSCNRRSLGMRLPHATGGAWERGYLMQQEPGNEATSCNRSLGTRLRHATGRARERGYVMQSTHLFQLLQNVTEPVQKEILQVMQHTVLNTLVITDSRVTAE